jgi:polysaccharide pyruvyl transferase WcaK-like protein
MPHKLLYFFRPPNGGPEKSALLFPGDDPGSLGDEAMLQATLTNLRRLGITKFGVGRWKRSREGFAGLVAGVVDEPLWGGALAFRRVLGRYQIFYIFGADVMDGHYSDLQSCQLVLYAHLARLWGRSSAILGFSFNRTPTANVIHFFRALHPDVALFARDPQSLKSFHSATGRSAQLTADTAFLLKPSGPTSLTDPVATWIMERRSMGGKVIGINVHPLLFMRKTAESKEQFLASFANLLIAMTRLEKFRFLLLPHDYRDGVGDLEMMAALYERLPESVRASSLFVRDRLSAAEAKEVCGSLHAVISGRMHLCIAALGQAVPTFGLSYQDKFRGLMRLFHQDYEPLLEAEECLDEAKLQAAVFEFLELRDSLKDEIKSRLPRVIAMARENFRFI